MMGPVVPILLDTCSCRSACVFWLFLPVDGKVFVDVESLAMLTVLLPPTPPLPIYSPDNR